MPRILKTEFKRIGRSGPTVDGRIISPQMIDQMAEDYDKELFTALIWPEHERYLNFGSVEALRSEPNIEGGRDLYAQLSPNEFYLSSNKYDQKLFTSMEINTDFRKSGRAYLSGLGATDSPASAATDEIRFSSAQLAGIIVAPPIAAETQIFTESKPLSFIEQLEEFFTKKPSEGDDVDKTALTELKTEMAEIKAMLLSLKPAAAPEPEKAEPPTLEQQFATLLEKLEQLEAQFTAQKDAPPASQFADLTAKIADIETRFNAALAEQPGTDAGGHTGGGTDYSNCL
jgi:hypothetical protein